MALVLADRVKETTTTTGTGTVTLAGAATGFQSFAAIGNGNTTYYAIVGQTGSEWEVGIGTYTSSGTTLSRDTVLASSNAGSLVSFSAGTKDVWCDYPAGKAAIGSGGTTTSSATDITLTSTSTQTQLVTMTAADKYVILPSATALAKGEGQFEITASATSYAFSIKNGAGDIVYGPVFPGVSVQLSLVDNSTSAGTWTANGTIAKGGYGPINVSSVSSGGYGGDSRMRVIGLSATSAVIAYYTSSTTLNVVAVSISGTAVTFGTPLTVSTVAYSDNGSDSISTIAVSSTTVVIAYGDTSNNCYLRAYSVSGTTLTAGTAVTVNATTTSTGINTGVLAYLTTNAGVVTFPTYNSGTSTTTCAIRAFTVSGTTITLGGVTTLASNAAAPDLNARPVITSTSGGVVLYNTDGSTVYLRAFTVSGTTLTFGTAVVMGLGAAYVNTANAWVSGISSQLQYSPATNYALFFTQYGTAVIVTTSGTTVSAYSGTQYTNQGDVPGLLSYVVPLGANGQAFASSNSSFSAGWGQVYLITGNSAGLQGSSTNYPRNTLQINYIGALDTQTGLAVGVTTSGTNTYLAAQILKVV